MRPIKVSPEVFTKAYEEIVSAGGSLLAVAAALDISLPTCYSYLKANKSHKENQSKEIHTKKTSPLRTHFIIPDTQVKPGVPTDYLSWIGEYIAHINPDVVVMLGDFADMESLSSYDKGKKSYEGRRYHLDIKASHAAMKKLMDPWRKLDCERHILHGNHECLDYQTEALTRRGWKRIDEIYETDEVFTLNKDGSGSWQNIEAIHKHEYNGDLIYFDSRTFSMAVTPNHRIIYKTCSGAMRESLAGEFGFNGDIITSANYGNGIDFSDDEIRLAAWLCTDSYHGNGISFYQNADDIHLITDLLDSLSYQYRLSVRHRDITTICGKKLVKPIKLSGEIHLSLSESRRLWNRLGVRDNLSMPNWISEVNSRQFDIFLDTIIKADGSIPTKAVNSRVFYGKKAICDDLQAAAIQHGWSATISEYKENQFRVNLTKASERRVAGKNKYTKHYDGIVWCLTVGNENFMVRRLGKSYFTGNSRITRAIENDAMLEGLISLDDLEYSKFGWTEHPFLQPKEIDGVLYAHYFTNHLSGRSLGGSIQNRVAKVGQSFTQGHQQGLEIGTSKVTARTYWGLVAGSCYIHDEEYRGAQGNNHWRGVIVKREVSDGQYSPMFVTMDYLCRRYEDMTLEEYRSKI